MLFTVNICSTLNSSRKGFDILLLSSLKIYNFYFWWSEIVKTKYIVGYSNGMIITDETFNDR